MFVVCLSSSVNFVFKSHLLQFSVDSFETNYNYSLGQSSHLVLFRILKFAFYLLFTNFDQFLIENEIASSTVFNGFY